MWSCDLWGQETKNITSVSYQVYYCICIHTHDLSTCEFKWFLRCIIVMLGPSLVIKTRDIFLLIPGSRHEYSLYIISICIDHVIIHNYPVHHLQKWYCKILDFLKFMWFSQWTFSDGVGLDVCRNRCAPIHVLLSVSENQNLNSKT